MKSHLAALAASLALCAACTTPRHTRQLPPPEPGANASDVAIRDISIQGQQGVSGELVPSHASSHLLVGAEFLDGETWQPIEEHLFVGIESSFETEGDWFGGEWGLSIAMPEGEESISDTQVGVGRLDVDLELYEAYFGLRRTFLRKLPVKPYVGTGLSIIYYNAEQQFRAAGNPTVEDEETDFTFGIYLHGGVALQLGENFQIGLDLRTIGGTDTKGLFRSDDLDYQRVTVFLGFGD